MYTYTLTWTRITPNQHFSVAWEAEDVEMGRSLRAALTDHRTADGHSINRDVVLKVTSTQTRTVGL